MLPSSHILKGLYAKHRFEWLQPTRLRALCSKDGIWEYYCKLKQAGNSIKTLLSKRTFRGSRNQVGVAPISLEASGEDCCFGSDHCNDVAAMKSNVKEWNPS